MTITAESINQFEPFGPMGSTLKVRQTVLLGPPSLLPKIRHLSTIEIGMFFIFFCFHEFLPNVISSHKNSSSKICLDDGLLKADFQPQNLFHFNCFRIDNIKIQEKLLKTFDILGC